MTDLVTFKSIQLAAHLIENVMIRTPTVSAPWLSKLCQSTVYLKLENLQITNSFKPRGAYIKLSRLTDDEKKRGVIAMSAGNHAQGVAYHAHALGIPATIVMPQNTPFAKVDRTQKLGAKVIQVGNSLAESGEYAYAKADQEELTLIHPYDDPDIITGQGTVALEMLADVPDLDVLVIPIGGGGLASGMAIAAKAINPSLKIIGVQSAYCPAMAEALFPDAPIQRENISASPLAEGIVVKSIGKLTQAILKENLEQILVVTEEQIENAIHELAVQGKVIAEGAGAAGVAALMAFPYLFTNKKVGTVICGGNIDSRILSSLLLRGLVHQGKLVRFKIQINDAPGVLAQLSQIIGREGGNIFEISHQRLFNQITVKMADVDAVVEVRDREHALKIIHHLQNDGFPTIIVE